MANIATCPKCAKQLGLPASIAATDRAECPECHAIFSLSETVQISLPVVRVLDPSEQPAAPIPTSSNVQPKLEESAVDTLADNAAPLKSWEERLKNALALDHSDEEATAGPLTPSANSAEPPVVKQPLPSKSPSFEFELEPAPSVATESKISEPRITVPKATESKATEPKAAAAKIATAKTQEPKQKTLGLDLPGFQPRTAPKTSPNPSAKRTSTLAKTLADFAPGELASASGNPTSPKASKSKPKPKSKLQPQPEPVDTRNAEAAVQTNPRKPVARSNFPKSNFPKVAALVAGPVIGSLLGLYGLLWVQGEQADYVGLARVLPATLLPNNFGESHVNEKHGAGSLAKTNSPDILKKTTELLTIIKRDEAVQPASALGTTPAAISRVRIDADEFDALVDAAEAALPEFVVGDFSESVSIKRKGQAYMAFCRLAEHFDFAQQPALAPAARAKAEQARQLFERTASQADIREDLSHIAGRWWEYDKRPTAGIFLVGEVRRTEQAGSGTLCWVKISEQSTAPTIPVWFQQEQYQAGDRLGVVGSVISERNDLPPGISTGQAVGAAYSFEL